MYNDKISKGFSVTNMINDFKKDDELHKNNHMVMQAMNPTVEEKKRNMERIKV